MISSILKPFLGGGAGAGDGFAVDGLRKLDVEGFGASSETLVLGTGDGGRSSAPPMSGGSGSLERNTSVSEDDSEADMDEPAIGYRSRRTCT